MSARRMWASAALLLTLAAVGLAVAGAAERFPRGLSVLLCLVLAIGATSFGRRRRRATRRLGYAISLLLTGGAIVLVAIEERVVEDLLVLAAFAAVLATARRAFRVHVHLPRATPPSQPTLFCNLESGGGKVARFDLVAEARRRGIEPVEIASGADLEQVVRDAVAAGADGLAMAGGDGSQAVVARIASELDLPYACIPAGTRNHFALDLGVDRRDVVGALDAFVNGGERRVDLAEVNGRVFVNNVSLGLYAEAVRRPGYREAKLQTLLDTVPRALASDAEPPRLRWAGASGPESAAAILISNNAYRLGVAFGSGTRPRLTDGLLGIAVLAPIDDGSVTLTMRQWTAERVEISCEGPTPAAIDGEAADLDAPLRFRTLPRALRVRIAPGHPGASPSALEPEGAWEALQTLVRIAVRGESAAEVGNDGAGPS